MTEITPPPVDVEDEARINYDQHTGEPRYFRTAENQSNTGTSGVRLICDPSTHDELSRTINVTGDEFKLCPNCGTPVFAQLSTKESKGAGDE